MPDEKLRYSVLLRNSSARPIKVILEPWYEERELPVGHNIRVEAEGTQIDQVLQIEYKERAIVVHAWAGSSVEIRIV